MELLDLTRLAFAFLVVLGLIGISALVARKAGLVKNAAALTRRRRLAVQESVALDARRRAIILRCDDQDHLIILGTGNDLLVSSTPAIARDETPEERPSLAAMFALHRGNEDAVDTKAA